MNKTLEKDDQLKTASAAKDTRILEVPSEVCQSEGIIISLTLKNDSISGVYLKPSKEIDDSVSPVMEEESEYFEEMKRIGN